MIKTISKDSDLSER